MSVPPCLMHLRIYNEEHNVNLWLPLFLAWLILAVLALALLPIFLIILIVAWPTGWGEFALLIGPRIYNILCALRGLKVDVNRQKEQIAITFV
jgi:uncharacterized membrane protein YqjE